MAHVDINATIGPEQVGVIAGAWMFGLATVQTFNYYSLFPSDSRRLKWSVGILWILELVHVILSCVALYDATVLHYGEPEHIEFIHRAISLSIVISTVVGPGVQMFFAERIRRLSGRWAMTLICWFLAFVRALTLLAVSITTQIDPFIPEFKQKWDWLVLTSLGVSTTADVLIAVSLCYLLWQKRSNGVGKTVRVVDSLIAWTINTGALTCIASFMMLFFFIFMANFAWVTMMLIIPRLFANSYLASLNSRSKMRDIQYNKSTIEFTTPVSTSYMATRPYESAGSQNISIAMTKTKETVVSEMEFRHLPNDQKDSYLGMAV